ncbi:cytochrome P450 315a1, mitochondrial isoform X2 [Leptopilina boulardi]|uniref:cytochrome P450 315a1, mitochondrial isoform X2 n=1 Tax=Leptopilina boulardi TaxID=63433 RepID=UPI0021F66FDC|nr:cytochrome P450 315a1, mitochondrial isoform X2 [Leptopilina boulardi]
MSNNFYTSLAQFFKNQVRVIWERCSKKQNYVFAAKKEVKIESAINTSHATVNSLCSIRQMPEDPIISVLSKIRFLIASRWGTKLHEYVDQRHKNLGPIYRSNSGSTSIVFINSSEEYRKIFLELEGPTPKHFIPEAWILYNNDHSKNLRGLFFMDGDEWQHFRKILNKVLLKSNSTDYMIDPCNTVARDLVNTLYPYANNGHVVPNLKLQIYNYSLQAILATLIGSGWSYHKKQILMETGQLSIFLHKIFLYSSRLNVISASNAKAKNLFWWRQFVNVVDDTLATVKKTVLLLIKLNGDGLLHQMMSVGIKSDDLIRIVADLIIAAGDTEVLLMSLYSSGRSCTNFTEPDKFLPERWMRLEKRGSDIVHNPGATIPFAIGVRSCIGKKLAEVKINLVLAQIIKNFHVECANRRPVKMILQMIAETSKPIQLKLTPR